jgi:hypothetical protein
MTEQESEFSYSKTELSVGHRYEVKNSQGEVIVRHEIFGIGPRPFLSLFGEEGEKLAQQDYRMFGAIMGYPDTASVRNVPDSFNSNEERFIIYLSSFREFYHEYFDEDSSKKPFLVYIHDFSFDNWSKDNWVEGKEGFRNIDKLVETLNDKGVCVTKSLEGDIMIDDKKIFHTVLLFERPNDTVLD